MKDKAVTPFKGQKVLQAAVLVLVLFWCWSWS